MCEVVGDSTTCALIVYLPTNFPVLIWTSLQQKQRTSQPFIDPRLTRQNHGYTRIPFSVCFPLSLSICLHRRWSGLWPFLVPDLGCFQAVCSPVWIASFTSPWSLFSTRNSIVAKSVQSMDSPCGAGIISRRHVETIDTYITQKPPAPPPSDPSKPPDRPTQHCIPTTNQLVAIPPLLFRWHHVVVSTFWISSPTFTQWESWIHQKLIDTGSRHCHQDQERGTRLLTEFVGKARVRWVTVCGWR